VSASRARAGPGAVAASALIADDEPLLRQQLRTHLARLWPELEIVAEARNGREAIELFERLRPSVAFLDVHMPGRDGLDAARAIARRAQIVFVTAYEHYAVQAFEQGAIDYLVKPFDDARLADSVARLQARLARPEPVAADIDAVLERLAGKLRAHDGAARPKHLQWIRASVGASVRLIPVDQVAYLRSDEKYTLVAWEGGEALIRKTIRELADALDPEAFAQIHRSVIVNLRLVVQFDRGFNETAEVRLKGRREVLPVSRSFFHVFRQM
jgi:DNA-binding LytR/AlgR family response regulator